MVAYNMIFKKNKLNHDKNVKFRFNFFNMMESFILLIIIITMFQMFVFRTFAVKEISMLPTLQSTDKVLITNFLYAPKAGDIVVIDEDELIGENIIRRVIATEGQSIKIKFDTGEVYVDEKLLDESYINTPTNTGDSYIPEIIPEGYIFVMGDNRNHSLDSRFTRIGLIDKKNIIGKIQFIIFPFSRWGST